MVPEPLIGFGDGVDALAPGDDDADGLGVVEVEAPPWATDPVPDVAPTCFFASRNVLSAFTAPISVAAGLSFDTTPSPESTVGYCTSTNWASGIEAIARPIDTILSMLARLVERLMLSVAAAASPYSLVMSVSVEELFILRTSAERNTCCELMRVRSLPSPTPCLVRRNSRAVAPCSVCSPAERCNPV